MADAIRGRWSDSLGEDAVRRTNAPYQDTALKFRERYGDTGTCMATARLRIPRPRPTGAARFFLWRWWGTTGIGTQALDRGRGGRGWGAPPGTRRAILGVRTRSGDGSRHPGAVTSKQARVWRLLDLHSDGSAEIWRASSYARLSGSASFPAVVGQSGDRHAGPRARTRRPGMGFAIRDQPRNSWREAAVRRLTRCTR